MTTLLASQTRGDQPSVDFAWQAPAGEECPSAPELQSAVDRAIGPAPLHARVRARATAIRIDAGRWRLDLDTSLDGTTGHRTFEGASCRGVADAAVVIVAWIVDPSLSKGALASEPPPITPSPDERARPETSVSEPRLTHATMSLEAALDSGTLPTLQPGIAARPTVEWGPWRAGLYGAYWPRATATNVTADGRNVGGTFSLLVAGLEGCVGAVHRRVQLGGCAGPELDTMHGAGFGVRSPGEGRATWAAMAAAATLELALDGPFSLVGRAGAVVPLQRKPFALEALGTVHEPSVIAARAAIGIAASFW